MEGNKASVWSVGGALLGSLDELKPREGARGLWNNIEIEKFEIDPYGYLEELYVKKEISAAALPEVTWERQVLDALHLKYMERRMDKSRVKTVSLNDTVRVKNGQVVSFRCMIQDHVRTECSMAERELTNPITKEIIKSITALLRDRMLPNELDNFSAIIEKEVYVAISPPGENIWVSMESSTAGKPESDLDSKRAKLSEMEKNEGFNSLANYKDILPSVFAVPGKTNQVACIIKMYKYDDDFNYKHNDLVEVTGLIELPTGEDHEEDADEVSYPGQNQLPIIHVFSCIRLADGNPKAPLLEGRLFPLFLASEIKMVECAQALRDILSLSLGCDRYAAAYAMIAIIARAQFVESQATGPVGKFVLNISGISEASDIPSVLSYTLESLLPRTINLDFGIDTVNAMKLVPKKNLSTDQLEAALLQLPAFTTLIINETGLEEGQFDESGVGNLIALRELLTDQKVKYDYTYQFPVMEANYPTIIISKSPSILPFDVRIEINPEMSLTLAERRSRIESILKEKGEMLRNYLTIQRFTPLTMRLFDYQDESLMNDIVEYLGQRNSSELFKSKMSATEYSAFITSCRSWCLLHGEESINRDGLMFWKELERIRDSRLPH